MGDIKDQEMSAFQGDTDLYNKPTNAISRPEKNIGIDTDGAFVDDLIYAGENSKLDMSKINAFTQLSQNRESLYEALDSMADDSTVAAVLETYAEDATETNDQGKIVWAQSDDAETANYVNFLIDSLNIDKNVYKWIHSLCKYGDLYLRLYRRSEYDDGLFDKQEDKQALKEDIQLKVFSWNDKYAHYIEMVPNPAQMFELTRFGKSYAYIKAPNNAVVNSNNNVLFPSYRYSFKKQDIEVYPATEFVHACLDDNTSRIPEEVQIFLKDSDYETNQNGLSYTVRRGQSLLYSSFKSWRELMLLQNSLLLNRLTKSAMTRVVQVEIGDMPKEQVKQKMYSIKSLLEQKSAIDVGNAMQDYTNPGPMENIIYVPVKDGKGAITQDTIGGDVDVKGISDINYFEDNMFGALRVPKQYFGRTDDNAGFSGGQSLSIISSRYAKAIKRIQNTMLQALTDAINLMLLDKELTKYVGKFELHMLPPTTQEEIDRKDVMQGKIGNAADILNLLGDIDDQAAKLRIVKSLASSVIDDPEIIDIIQEQIDRLEETAEIETVPEEDDLGELGGESSGMHTAGGGSEAPFGEIFGGEEPELGNEPEAAGGEETLPTPNDLGVDMTNIEDEGE